MSTSKKLAADGLEPLLSVSCIHVFCEMVTVIAVVVRPDGAGLVLVEPIPFRRRL
jgi:hypothetical protein